MQRGITGILLGNSGLDVSLKDPATGVCTAKQSSPYQSIPVSFYWSITTLTTVGYGDVVPVTPLGRFIASVTMLFGVLAIALPSSMLGAKFDMKYQQFKEKEAKKKAKKDAIKKQKKLGQTNALIQPNKMENSTQINQNNLSSLNLSPEKKKLEVMNLDFAGTPSNTNMANINLDRIAQPLNFKDSNIQMRHSRSKSVDQQHIPSDSDKNWSNKVFCWLLITYNGKELAKKVTINHKMQSLNAYIHEQVQCVLHDSYQQNSISFSKIRVTTDGYEISMDQDVPISDYANIKDQIHLEVMLE